MRVSILSLAGLLMAGIASQASGQSYGEGLNGSFGQGMRGPEVQQPVPVCFVSPIFCQPGNDAGRWGVQSGFSLVEDGGMQSSGYGYDIIVIDPSRVYLGADKVYIVPEGVQNPFVGP